MKVILSDQHARLSTDREDRAKGEFSIQVNIPGAEAIQIQLEGEQAAELFYCLMRAAIADPWTFGLGNQSY